jgi:hypothetical protein
MMVTKNSLSFQQRKFIELMQRIHFGQIFGLKVKDGEPVLDPHPRVLREIKLGGECSSRTELASKNFALKSQIMDFFAHLNRIKNGTVKVIEIKHGLPFLIKMDDTVRP